MQDPVDGMRMCPTRADGENALIAQKIPIAQCQSRQREHFHKCPTCTHFNVRAATEVKATAGEARPSGGQ